MVLFLWDYLYTKYRRIDLEAPTWLKRASFMTLNDSIQYAWTDWPIDLPVVCTKTEQVDGLPGMLSSGWLPWTFEHVDSLIIDHCFEHFCLRCWVQTCKQLVILAQCTDLHLRRPGLPQVHMIVSEDNAMLNTGIFFARSSSWVTLSAQSWAVGYLRATTWKIILYPVVTAKWSWLPWRIRKALCLQKLELVDSKKWTWVLLMSLRWVKWFAKVTGLLRRVWGRQSQLLRDDAWSPWLPAYTLHPKSWPFWPSITCLHYAFWHRVCISTIVNSITIQT